MDAIMLPEEILSMICNHLALERRHSDLFNCCLSGRLLVDATLKLLYHHHDTSFVFNHTEDDFQVPRQAVHYEVVSRNRRGIEQYFERWTKLWRSIVLSALQPCPTYRPYCKYLRTLDFRNLSEMLDSGRFQNLKASFYKGQLSSFKHETKQGRIMRVDDIPTINSIGEVVIPQAIAIEEISGKLRPGFLAKWIAMTSKLRHLTLWEGDALDAAAGIAIAEHCPQFEVLRIFYFNNNNADEIFSSFLEGLRPNTLRYLELISQNKVAKLSFQQLRKQADSMQSLKLNNVCSDAILNLNQLSPLINIEILTIEDNKYSPTRLLGQSESPDAYKEVTDWLAHCAKLRTLTLTNLIDAPSILSVALLSPDLKLDTLSVENYALRNNPTLAFHAVLEMQAPTLTTLHLRGSADDASTQDIETLVNSLCSLSKLRDLQLKDISDSFSGDHLTMILSTLWNLEEFWCGGDEARVEVLQAAGNLPNLRSLQLTALTQFDAKSLERFIKGLHPVRQKGFSLNLMSQDPDYDLKEEDVLRLDNYMVNNIGGKFDFNIWRDAVDFESDSD